MPYIGDSYVVRIQDPVTNITSMTNASLKMGRDTDNLIDFATTDNEIILRVAGVNEINVAANALSPVTSDGAALGTTSLMWSDLFAASGSVINFNNGDMTITHSSNTLTVAGGTFATAALTATTGVFSGILKTDDSTEATSTTDGSLQTDGGLSVVKDAVFGDDIKLLSDASVVAFGANGDVTLTHVHNTGLLLSDDSGIGTTQLQFGDSGTYIHQSADGVLDLVSDTEIEINATTIDINGSIDIDKNINIVSTPADTVYSGITASFTAGEALEIGEVVYYKAADDRVWKAVGKVGGTGLISAAIPAIGVVAADQGSAGSAVTVLLQGFIRADTNFPTWTKGGTIYVPEDETSSKNVPEQAAPDTDGDFVQILGWAVDANTTYVNPDFTIIEVA